MSDDLKERGGATETVARTLLVAFLVSLVCSSLVASAAILLKPRQVANALLDMRRNILEVAGLLEPDSDVNELYGSVERRVIDLATGAYVQGADPTLDPQRALVYLVRQDGELSKIILPVSGQGLWSTLYGFLALAPDTTTIEGMTFYEHGETPGLGGEIDNPRWKSLWKGRSAYDAQWQPAITVIKGAAGPAEDDPFRVDGLSGATLTCRGVSDLVQFWLSGDGFEPFLAKFRAERSAA